ncbi:MAG: IPT/TIG domain-containing protein [Planctomycetes bacterium]|nr:IPT/TIG domain-containing protein [Planctomycetota bacterium]
MKSAFVTLLIFALASCGGATHPPQFPAKPGTLTSQSSTGVPQIGAISPLSVLNSTASFLTITGSGLSETTQVILHTPSGVSLTGIQIRSASEILVTIPKDLPEGDFSLSIKVLSGATGSNPLVKLNIADPPQVAPTVDAVSPNQGLSDAEVKVAIAGTNLQGVWAVTFDDSASTPLRDVKVVSKTEIRATVPAFMPAGVYNVIVTTEAGSNAASAEKYTSVDPSTLVPVVLSVSPKSVVNSLDAHVTITGNNLEGATAVRLNDSLSTSLTDLVSLSNTKLNATIPAMVAPGTYAVIVSNAYGNSEPGGSITFVGEVAPGSPGAYSVGETSDTFEGDVSLVTMAVTTWYPGASAGVNQDFAPTTSSVPLIVFAYDREGDAQALESYARHLASWGYVTFLADFQVSNSIPDEGYKTRIMDLVKYLVLENSRTGSTFDSKLDLSRIGIVAQGDSAGPAIDAANEDGRISAISLMVPAFAEVVFSGALQILSAEHDGVYPQSSNANQIYLASSSPKSHVTIRQANHRGILDQENSSHTGDGEATIDRAETQGRARKYLTSFFELYLKGKTAQFEPYAIGALAQIDALEGLIDLQVEQ